MTNYYVAKDGSDANNGTTWALAKLTVQAGVNLLANGDTLYIGPGTYYEAVTRSFGSSMSVTIQGSGYVIMDGGSVLSNGFYLYSTSGGVTVYMYDIIVKSYTLAGIVDGGSTWIKWYLYRTRIQNCLYGYSSSNRPSVFTAQNCIFHDNTHGVYISAAGGLVITITYCTFSDNQYGVTKSTAGSGGFSLTIKHCVLSNNSRHYNISNTTYVTPANIDYNCVYFDGTADSLWSATTETTLAGWRITTSTADANSVSKAPGFLDRAKKCYALHASTTLYDDLIEGGDVGAGYQQTTVAVGMSYSDPDGNFANRILVDTQVNAGNNIECSSLTYGTARTGVIDLGGQKTIRRLNIKTTLDKAKYPADVPDEDTTDVQPKRMNFRWRYSATAFVPGDASPDWIDIEPSAVGEDENVIGRYVQTEVTLRVNGT